MPLPNLKNDAIVNAGQALNLGDQLQQQVENQSNELKKKKGLAEALTGAASPAAAALLGQAAIKAF